MKKVIHYLLAIVIMICAPQFSDAHPGHGHDNPLSPGHYVGNLEHLIPLLIVVALSVAVAWSLNRIVDRVNEK
jgi:hypothetical protein